MKPIAMAKAIHVSAPGSVMLMGEHAVVFGHRAIVCAVDKRISVSLTPRSDQHIRIRSALADLDATLDALPENKDLSFVLGCIKRVQPQQGFELTIESSFSHTVGLGSSAAVTAATVYALLLYRDGEANLDDVFDTGLQVIHDVQQRGSGSDLAASVFGGVLGYTVKPRAFAPLLNADTEARWPRLDLFYCGYKMPTPAVLAQVAEQAERFPDLYKALYQQMHEVSMAAESAVQIQDWAGLGRLMNLYHGLMDALGVSDKTLSSMIYTAREQQGVLGAKISGSGLGDCIITLSDADAPAMQDMTVPDAPAKDTGKQMSAELSPTGLLIHDD